MTQIHPLTFKKTPNDLWIGGCSLTSLAETYGTPLYVLDESTIIKNCRSFTESLSRTTSEFTIAYASKAGLTIGLSNLLASEKMGADVVSGGELYTILNSKIDPQKVYFHGNNKSKQELDFAITNNIRLVVDNAHELEQIIDIATQKKVYALVMFRIKPGIEAHTHEYIKTGHIDSKFGFEFNEALPLIIQTSSLKWVEFIGIHSHIGSQIFDKSPYIDLAKIMVDFMANIASHSIDVKELNLGGGFGVNYTVNDTAPAISNLVSEMANHVINHCKQHNLIPPKLIFEPGRSIIANAGVTLYTVGCIKKVSHGSHYIFIDGGMADNPRPMMYQSQHTFDIVAPTSSKMNTYTIAGKFCESGDIIATNIELPEVTPNQHIVVYGTGAYNYSMASNYNRFCKPAMVLVTNGTAKLMVKRETYADIIRNDMP
jgi:diaminopimelate decarboxylase